MTMQANIAGKSVLTPRTMERFDGALQQVRASLKGVDLIAALESERREEIKSEERKIRGSR